MSVEAAEGLLAASRLAPPDEALSLRIRAAEQLLSAGHIERGERILDEQLERLGLSLPSSTPGRLLGAVRDTLGRRVDRWRPARTSEARLAALWSATRGALLVEPVRALALGASLVREAARPGASPHARMTAAFIEAMSSVAPRGPEALPRALARLAAELTDDAEPRVLEAPRDGKGHRRDNWARVSRERDVARARGGHRSRARARAELGRGAQPCSAGIRRMGSRRCRASQGARTPALRRARGARSPPRLDAHDDAPHVARGHGARSRSRAGAVRRRREALDVARAGSSRVGGSTSAASISR